MNSVLKMIYSKEPKEEGIKAADSWSMIHSFTVQEDTLKKGKKIDNFPNPLVKWIA